jgi:regulator of nucleoside diphosphate kinase
MQKIKEQLLLTKKDYEIILSYLKLGYSKNTFNRQDAEELKAELKKAKLVAEDELPADVVRLNSTVTIRDEKELKAMEVMIVAPEKADIKQRKISVLSPIGTALIGFQKGRKVSWKVPAGKKTFIILEVTNPFRQCYKP